MTNLVGLCETCGHARVIESRAGSRFYLCQRSRTDPAYPRYPRLPVLRCRGYEPAEGQGGGAADDPRTRAGSG